MYQTYFELCIAFKFLMMTRNCSKINLGITKSILNTPCLLRPKLKYMNLNALVCIKSHLQRFVLTPFGLLGIRIYFRIITSVLT